MTDTRIRYLDGLRGVLAVIVFVHHFFYAFYPEILFGGEYSLLSSGKISFEKIIAFTPINILFNPGAAIHFFFFLSGYVQSFHYFQKADVVLLQKSFIKRYFRLAIPVLAAVLLVFVFHKLHLIRRDLMPNNALTAGWSKGVMPDNLSFFQVVNYGLLETFFGSSKYYQVLWTMPIELYNSWMVLILALVTHQLKNKIYLFGFWIAIQLFVVHSYNSVAFTMGMTICCLQVNSPAFGNFLSKRFVKIFCLVIGLYFASYPYVGYENATKNTFYSPIAFFDSYLHVVAYLFGDLLLLCFLLYSNRSKTLLSGRVFLFFGNISFMLYLVHLLLIFSFSPWLYKKLFDHMGFYANVIITGLATFIVVTIASYLLYEFTDKPILRACNVYIKKVFGV